jgi:hypothetical protein
VLAAISFIPTGIEHLLQEILFIVGGVMACLSLYVAVRKQSPRAARWMATPVRAIRWLILLPFRLLYRLWRQLWRDKHGVSRGPVRRINDNASNWLTSLVRAVVGPLIDDVRATSKQQHDEQNTKIDGLTDHVTKEFGDIKDRLERGSLVMQYHTDAISQLKTTIAELSPNKEQS